MFILVIKTEKKAGKGKDYPCFQNNILSSITSVKNNIVEKRAKIYYVYTVHDVNWELSIKISIFHLFYAAKQYHSFNNAKIKIGYKYIKISDF